MSKKSIIITESQVKQMVENINAKSKGQETKEIVKESVDNNKKTKVIKLTENEFRKMLMDLSKKIG